MINEYKYSDLESMIIMNNREDKIDKIWKWCVFVPLEGLEE
jgi:hypothetical protein